MRHTESHSPIFSSLAESTAIYCGAPTCLIKSWRDVYAYALFFRGTTYVYPLLSPRNTCAHVKPLEERTSGNIVSELKPSASRFGLRQGSLHLICFRGINLVSASTELTSCVVANKVCLVVSKFKRPRR